MNFFDILKNIYQKNKIIPNFDDGFAIIINKWLSWDKNNIYALRRVIKDLFYIEPTHYLKD